MDPRIREDDETGPDIPAPKAIIPARFASSLRMQGSIPVFLQPGAGFPLATPRAFMPAMAAWS